MRKAGIILIAAFCLAIITTRVETQVAGDFRSNQSGNWNDVNAWERFDGTMWVTPAPSTPTSADGAITIRSGHTVTVTAAVTVDQVTVDAGGQVTITSGIGWTIANGTGTDLTINGTVLNSGLALFSSAGPTWVVNAGGTYIHNTTSGIATPLGGATLNAASNFIYRGSSTLTPAISMSGRTYGNLSFESTSGNWTASVSGAGTLTINGDFTIGTGVTYSTTQTGVMTFAGDFTNNGTLTNSTGTQVYTFTGSSKTISGSSAITFETWNVNAGASITLARDVSIASTFTGTISGTLNCGTNIVSGAGNFTLASGGTLGIGSTAGITSSGATGNIQVTGTRSYNTAANYTYNGSAAQVTGNGLPSSINNLTINNSAGVTLDASTTVNGTLALTSGDLMAGANILTQAGSSSGTGDVIGTVRRTDLGGTARAFGNPFNTITINSGTAPTQMDANLVKSTPVGFATAITRTYTLTPTGGSGFSATVRLHYLDSELNGNTEGMLNLFRFDSPSWTQIAPTASDTTDNWVEASGITTFSPWTIASQGPVVPVCSLTPMTATNQAGTSHTVTATVTLSGSPLMGVMVNFSVTAGPNLGASGTGTTDVNGQAMFTYTSNGTVGTDTIQASGTAMSQMFSCTAMKTWVAPACSLSPPTAINAVSTSHTATVTVTNGGTPAQGITVNFSVTSGPNTGATGMGTTDVNGQAMFTYTSNGTPGTDTIQASGGISSVTFSCTATKEWVAVGCSLSPLTETNPVGSSHTVTVTVTQNGSPASGVAVNFNITSGPNTGASGTGTTDVNGQAMFTYTSNGTSGTDTIQASGIISSVPFSCTATKTWIAAACTLAPPTDTNLVDTSHTVTTTVTQDGAPASGISVTFNVISGPNSGATGSGTTDGSGQTSFTYTSNGTPGTDTIEASGSISGVSFSCTAMKTWVSVPIVINEVDSDTPGTDAAEFVELYDGGAGNSSLTGLVVVFYNGSNDLSYAAFDLDGFSTDANGYFVLGNAAVPGVDLTFADNLLQNGADAVALYFANAADFPTNTPVTTTNLVDAIVYDTSDADDPGLLVLLNSGQPQVDENANMNSANQSLQRCPNGFGGARNTNTYLQATPTPGAANNCPVPMCSLDPPTATNLVGTSHTVTATVTLSGSPVSGIAVTFTVTMGPNAGATGMGTTDVNGQTSFTYMSNGMAGTDTVQASGTVQGEPFSCTATKTWQANVVECMLTPASAANPAGTSHTVTVTVTLNGSPASGVSVNFNVTAGPNAGTNGSGTTNGSGQTTFTYTSNGTPGTDTIQASGSLSGTPFSCTAMKTWVATSVIINEVDSDTTGTDNMEFVELFDGGAGNTSLDGLVVVFFNGGDDQSYAAFDLDGFTTDANGYFVLGNAAVPGVDLVFVDNLMQNGTDAIAFYIGSASDFPNGTNITTTNLIDALVYDTNDADDAGLLVLLNSGQPQVDEAGGGNSSADSNQRCPNGSGGARTTTTYIQAAPTPGATNACPPPVSCILSPASATNPVGTSHTVTVTVTNMSAPASGVMVSFSVTAGPNAGASGSGTTNASGQTSFTYTSNGTLGTDMIQASGMVNVDPFLCTATKTWKAIPPMIINEVDADNAMSDNQEFIELYDGGIGNTSLDGLVVVLFNGSNDQSYAAFDLDGFATDANGYFVIGSAAVPGVDLVIPDDTLQNGADAVALYVGNASNFPNGTPVTTASLIDALVYDTDDADDSGLLALLNSGQPQVNEGGEGNSAADSNQRCPNGAGGARNTTTYRQAEPTPGAANRCDVIMNFHDEEIDNCLRLNLTTGAYLFKTATDGTYTGTVIITQQGMILNFQSVASDPNWLTGGIDLGRRKANARLQVPRGRRGQVYAVSDFNIDNNPPCR
jgi:hypothetical protein